MPAVCDDVHIKNNWHDNEESQEEDLNTSLYLYTYRDRIHYVYNNPSFQGALVHHPCSSYQLMCYICSPWWWQPCSPTPSRTPPLPGSTWASLLPREPKGWTLPWCTPPWCTLHNNSNRTNCCSSMSTPCSTREGSAEGRSSHLHSSEHGQFHGQWLILLWMKVNWAS